MGLSQLTRWQLPEHEVSHVLLLIPEHCLAAASPVLLLYVSVLHWDVCEPDWETVPTLKQSNRTPNTSISPPVQPPTQ